MNDEIQKRVEEIVDKINLPKYKLQYAKQELTTYIESLLPKEKTYSMKEIRECVPEEIILPQSNYDETPIIPIEIEAYSNGQNDMRKKFVRNIDNMFKEKK